MENVNLINALAQFKDYDLEDGITVINVIQQLRQKGIHATNVDVKELEDDLIKKLDLHKVSMLNQSASPSGLKYLPMHFAEEHMNGSNVYYADHLTSQRNLASGNNRKVSYRTHIIANPLLPIDQYYGNDKHKYVTANLTLNYADSKINDYQFDWHLHAFKCDSANGGKLTAEPEKDLHYTYDAETDPIRKLSDITKELNDKTNEDPSLVYLYNFGARTAATKLDTPMTDLVWQDVYASNDALYIIDSDDNFKGAITLSDNYQVANYEKHNRHYTIIDNMMNKSYAKYFNKPWDMLKGVQVHYIDDYQGDWNERMVKSFTEGLNLKPGYKLYFDRYFTTVNDINENSSEDPKAIKEFVKSLRLSTHVVDTANLTDIFEITDPALAREIEAYFVLKDLIKAQGYFIRDDLARAVAWILDAQQQKFKINNTQKDKDVAWQALIKKVNPAMRELLKGLDLRQNKDDHSLEITVSDLVQYMDDIINGRPVDSKMFALITNTKDLETSIKDNKYALQQAISLDLSHKIDYVDDKTEQEIKNLLSPNVISGISKIYRIHQNKKLDGKVKTLVHGTGNISVLNILGQGLLDHNTLLKNHSKNYEYTGNGLGDGIYFARPDQVEKSLNYAGGSRHRYIFICSVAYHKIYNAKNYNVDLDAKGCDLVWGHAVGSYDRDELVAKSPKQVRLEYIVEF